MAVTAYGSGFGSRQPRFSAAIDLPLTATLPGEEVAQWRILWRAGDAGLEVHASVTSGSFAIRFDSDPTNLLTLLPGSGVLTNDLSLPAGVKMLRVVAVTPGVIDLIEVYVR